jgi:ABC-type phosphate/phosphonate transport system substrate-binding protein
MRSFVAVGFTLLALAGAAVSPSVAVEKQASPLTLVVMDPLSAPLSCPCVAGYAQRDYEKLAKFLEKQLGRPIEIHFSDSLVNALAKKTNGKADLVIGKDSVVRFEAGVAKRDFACIGSLTGKDGLTTQTGLVVVASADPALTVNDLPGYRVLFGQVEADEKHAAAFKLFKDLGVARPEKLETCPSCTDGATKTLEYHKAGDKVACVVSSYAKPLLEGCGTIKKGELRVVGETDAVPFIAAYASANLPQSDRDAIQAALLKVAAEKELCTVMETKLGFVKPPASKKN